MIIVLAISIIICIAMMLILNSTVADHVRMIEELHRRIKAIEVNNELEESKRVDLHINTNNSKMVTKAIDGLEEKTKSCSIDGVCNYMNKFTNVR